MQRFLLTTILVWPLLAACEKSTPAASGGKQTAVNYDKGDKKEVAKPAQEEAPKKPATPGLLTVEEIPAARAANTAAVKALAASLVETADSTDMNVVMARREAFSKIQRENGRIIKSLKALNDEAGFKAYNQEMNAAGFTDLMRKVSSLIMPRRPTPPPGVTPGAAPVPPAGAAPAPAAAEAAPAPAPDAPATATPAPDAAVPAPAPAPAPAGQ